MNRFITLAAIILFGFSSCVSSKEKATKVYEEGVALSQQASASLEKGDATNAQALYKQSIEKFDAALQLDSTLTAARSAKAASLYGSGQYQDALSIYQQVNGTEGGETAASLRDIGLIKLHQGELTEGQEFLDKAITLDHSKELVAAINKELLRIGEKNFNEGAELKKQGDSDTAKKHQSYAMNVLMLAYYYDNTRKDVAGKIAEYADVVGDYTVKMQYTKLSQ